MQSTKRDLGIDILKMIMAFEVICCHSSFVSISFFGNLIIALENVAVPTFMLISFFYESKRLIDHNSKVTDRIKKLYILHILWSLIYFASNIIYNLINHVYCLPIKELLYQLAFGHSLNTVMWFQISLIVITGFLYLISKLIKNTNKYLISVVIICLLSYILMYTKINYYLFGNLQWELKYTLGRIIECIPFACIGLLLGYFKSNIDELSYIKLVFLILISIIISYFTWNIECNGFGYSKVNLIIISSSIFIVFYKLSGMFNKLKIFNHVTKYTKGIYFIHLFIIKVINRFTDSIVYNIYIYILCYLICFVIDYLSKHKLKFLVN